MRYFITAVLLLSSIFLFAQIGAEEIDFSIDERVLDSEYIINSFNWQLADEYFKREDFESCIKVLRRIVALNPTDVEAYSTLGWLLSGEKRTDEAKAIYKEMVENNENSADANFEMGFYYYRLENFENALPYLKKAFELGVELKKANIYGNLLERLGREEEAKEVYEELKNRFSADEPIAEN